MASLEVKLNNLIIRLFDGFARAVALLFFLSPLHLSLSSGNKE